MSNFNIDENAITYIRDYLIDVNVKTMRVFIGGGGCCSRLEITPVDKALAGDVTYERGGVTIHVDKAIIEGASSIEIGFDEEKGLLINLN